MIIKKASQRIYFLGILKRTHTKSKLWNVYFTLIRSILEYAAPIFMAISKNLSSSLEKFQRKAHHIICDSLCVDVNCALSSLADRRVLLSARLFPNIMKNDASHPLAYLCLYVALQTSLCQLLIPFKKKLFVIQNIFIHNNITNIV